MCPPLHRRCSLKDNARIAQGILVGLFHGVAGGHRQLVGIETASQIHGHGGICGGADLHIIAQDAVVGENCTIGVGEYADSQYNKKVYCCDLVTVAEGSEIPDGVTIGKNVAIAGKTAIEDYPDGNLVSGGYIIKGGEEE